MSKYKSRGLLVPLLTRAVPASPQKASAVLAFAVGMCFSLNAAALNFSFEDSFSKDDDVALLSFSADGVSMVRVISYGYGGGTLSNGNVVNPGGFDPIITLFDAGGLKVVDNDDASSSGCSVGTDPVTGFSFDACIDKTLAAGTYTVALTQYKNFALGPNLLNGFERDGEPSFTAGLSGGGCTNGQFCDVSGHPTGNNRTSNWALDISNVTLAAVGPVVSSVPEPMSYMLLSLGLAGLGLNQLRRRRS